MRDGLLSLATLGIQSYKDGLYRTVAKGYPEHASRALFPALISGLILLPLFLLVQTRSLLASLRRRLERLDDSDSADTFSRVRNRLLGDFASEPEKAFRIRRRILFGLVMLQFYLAGAVIADLVKAQYCAEAISHYQRLRAVIAPHVSQSQLLQYDFRFATIQTRDDYYVLVKELDNEARQHTSKLPDFSVW